MEDKLFEVWRKEFEEWIKGFPGSPLDKAYMFNVWLAAKQSQPVVELPRLIHINDASVSGSQRKIHNDLLLMISKQFESAGIPFKVRGE